MLRCSTSMFLLKSRHALLFLNLLLFFTWKDRHVLLSTLVATYPYCTFKDLRRVCQTIYFTNDENDEVTTKTLCCRA